MSSTDRRTDGQTDGQGESSIPPSNFVGRGYKYSNIEDMEDHLELLWRKGNTLWRRQDGRHFPDDIFLCIFLNENEWHSNKISLKFVPKVPINNIPALVPIMAWCRPGDKPLSEPMMVVLPMYIYGTRLQWVTKWRIHYQEKSVCVFNDNYIHLLTIKKGAENIISHSQFIYRTLKIQHGKLLLIYKLLISMCYINW